MAMFTLSPSGLLAKDSSIDTVQYSGTDPTFTSRYILQAAVLDAYQSHQGAKKLKVLDVGGAGTIIDHFIDLDLHVVDLLPNVSKRANYTRASALKMPYADNSFDAVISCDVLEHIAKEDRATFLKESARVTKDLMIVAAPFNLKGVRDAEIAANNFYKKMAGKEHPWLIEHLADELPNLQLTHNVLANAGLQTAHFSHTALDNWQLIVRAGFLLVQDKVHNEFTRYIQQVNQYYLDHIMGHDFSATGYRTFLIASKKHEVDIKTEPDVYQADRAALFTLLTDAILPLL